MNSPRSSWDALTAELFQNKKDIGQVREPGVSRWVDGHELAGLSVTRQVYPGCCIKNQLMLFGCLFGPRMGYGASKWVLSRTMFQPRMLNGSPERRVSTSHHARSQCMSESQGRSIRGFDRWDFTNEHVEVS